MAKNIARYSQPERPLETSDRDYRRGPRATPRYCSIIEFAVVAIKAKKADLESAFLLEIWWMKPF